MTTPDVFGVRVAGCPCGYLRCGLGPGTRESSLTLTCPRCGQVVEVVGSPDD